MKKYLKINTAEVFELKDGRIGKTAALAITRLILDYARRHPEALTGGKDTAGHMGWEET